MFISQKSQIRNMEHTLVLSTFIAKRVVVWKGTRKNRDFWFISETTQYMATVTMETNVNLYASNERRHFQ